MWGIVVGYLFAHTVPWAYQTYNEVRNPKSKFGGDCSHCLFSQDVFTSPQNTIYCEWEMVKDHVLFHLITAGRTNCLSHLYTDKDKSVGHIFSTVRDKLGELQS